MLQKKKAKAKLASRKTNVAALVSLHRVRLAFLVELLVIELV